MSTLRAFDGRIRQVRGARTVLVGVVALTLAGCTAGLVWQSLHTPSAEDLNEVRTEALAAGRSSAKTLLSYDHRTLDKDFAAGRRVATGEFKQQYTKTTAKTVTPNAKKLHVTVTAEVVSASVVTASPERVELLLFVNQNTVSDLVKNGRLDQNRVLMTMVPVDGQWRVAQLKSL